MAKFLICVFCFLLLLNLPNYAQKVSEKSVTGTYMLQGVMETAAGFDLKPDHTFEYGFTYGAADKWGKGTWKLVGNKVQLTSQNKQPEQDFVLKYSDNSFNRGVRIRVLYGQEQPLPHIKCRLGEETATTGTNGEVYFKEIYNGILELYHPVYSIRVSWLNLPNTHTNFLISLVTDPSEVYFEKFEMEATAGEIISQELPGMPPQDAAGNLKRYVFKRQK